MKEYQVTLFCKSGKYRPVASIVRVEATTPIEEIKKKGIVKICQKRYWTNKDLKKYEYTLCKVRENKKD